MEERSVPYIVWEGERARDERRHKRDFIVKLVLIILLFVTNAIWLYSWAKSDYGVSVDVGESGIANYIGHDGTINSP